MYQEIYTQIYTQIYDAFFEWHFYQWLETAQQGLQNIPKESPEARKLCLVRHSQLLSWLQKERLNTFGRLITSIQWDMEHFEKLNSVLLKPVIRPQHQERCEATLEGGGERTSSAPESFYNNPR